mmetsp:Transcript_4030/g.18395  ORF Transcript_4030/g.18395 Transcript_4030/m.18395 type:complete len:205 (+) Transcript_4030:73-687(+)
MHHKTNIWRHRPSRLNLPLSLPRRRSLPRGGPFLHLAFPHRSAGAVLSVLLPERLAFFPRRREGVFIPGHRRRLRALHRRAVGTNLPLVDAQPNPPVRLTDVPPVPRWSPARGRQVGPSLHDRPGARCPELEPPPVWNFILYPAFKRHAFRVKLRVALQVNLAAFRAGELRGPDHGPVRAPVHTRVLDDDVAEPAPAAFVLAKL